MLRLVVSTLLLFGTLGYAEEPPTFESDPSAQERATGLVKPPLTAEQARLKSEFNKLSEERGWTFNTDVTQIGKYKTGYIPGKTGLVSTMSERFRYGASKIKPVSWAKQHTILDQGQCGSCVVFSVGGNFQLSHTLRNVILPALSMQHLMNCGGEAGQCGGDWGENVCNRLVNLRGLTEERLYPYTALSSRCTYNEAKMPLYGQIDQFVTIDPSFESIVSHIADREPVSVGVAADNRFFAYRSGIYNGFGSMATNHYVLALGFTCGTSVDKDGYCLFNERGQLVNGNHEATLIVANSWSQDWGDRGFIEMLFENKAGRRNNNIGGGPENAQVLKTGIPVPPEGPVEYTLNHGRTKLVVTVQPGKYRAEAVKQSLEKAGF